MKFCSFGAQQSQGWVDYTKQFWRKSLCRNKIENARLVCPFVEPLGVRREQAIKVMVQRQIKKTLLTEGKIYTLLFCLVVVQVLSLASRYLDFHPAQSPSNLPTLPRAPVGMIEMLMKFFSDTCSLPFWVPLSLVTIPTLCLAISCQSPNLYSQFDSSWRCGPFQVYSHQ